MIKLAAWVIFIMLYWGFSDVYYHDKDFIAGCLTGLLACCISALIFLAVGIRR